MDNIKQFTVGNTTYNAVMASAVKQDELLTLLTDSLMGRAVVATQLGGSVNEQVVIPMLMSLPYETKVKVASILMNRVVVHGGSTPVTVDSFAGKMVEYNTLLAQLLQWNLADFFTWLDSAVKSARPNQAENPVTASTGI